MIWGLALGLLGLSALTSGTETALFFLDPVQRAACARSPSRLDRLVDRLLGHPRALLQVVLFANLCVNVAFFAVLSAASDGRPARVQAVVLAVGVASVILLGELLPKILAWSRPLAVARTGAWPLSVLVGLLGSAWKPIDRLASAVARALVGTDTHESWASREEIAQHLARTHEQDGGPAGRLLSGILDMESRSVATVMVPRVDLAVVPSGADRDTCLAALARSPENRGVFLGGEDLERCLPSEELWSGEDPGARAATPACVPEQAGCLAAIRDLRQRNRTFGVVVDEHGGAVGVVWMEDLLGSLSGRRES